MPLLLATCFDFAASCCTAWDGAVSRFQRSVVAVESDKAPKTEGNGSVVASLLSSASHHQHAPQHATPLTHCLLITSATRPPAIEALRRTPPPLSQSIAFLFPDARSSPVAALAYRSPLPKLSREHLAFLGLPPATACPHGRTCLHPAFTFHHHPDDNCHACNPTHLPSSSPRQLSSPIADTSSLHLRA